MHAAVFDKCSWAGYELKVVCYDLAQSSSIQTVGLSRTIENTLSPAMGNYLCYAPRSGN